MVTSLRPIIAAVFALLLLTAAPALAHDELLDTTPTDGQSLTTAPEDITLTFSGQIAQVGAQVEVTDDSGESMVDGAPQVEGTDVVQRLRDLPGGDYEVLWRVTSEDGHPISGDFTFTVEEAADEAEETEDEATEEATESADASEEATSEAPAATAEDTASPAPTSAADETDENTTSESGSTGLPVWAWVTIGAAVLALLGLLGTTLARRRS